LILFDSDFAIVCVASSSAIAVQHTSASLSINENCDPDVRLDMETALNRMVPENVKYRHDSEGPDDMPAHVKATIVGPSVTVPITNGSLNLGTWQGLYLLEHRNHGGSRTIIVTLQGELFK
jgi:secondary thiamine-phosphate synthase enzyme